MTKAEMIEEIAALLVAAKGKLTIEDIKWLAGLNRLKKAQVEDVLAKVLEAVGKAIEEPSKKRVKQEDSYASP